MCSDALQRAEIALSTRRLDRSHRPSPQLRSFPAVGAVERYCECILHAPAAIALGLGAMLSTALSIAGVVQRKSMWLTAGLLLLGLTLYAESGLDAVGQLRPVAPAPK